MAKKPKDKIPANINTNAVLEGNFVSISGQLEKPGDHDWFKAELVAGVTYDFYLSFQNKGDATIGDASLILHKSNGDVETLNDDGGVAENSLLSFTATTSGTYFIDVGESGDNNAGSYGLVMLSSQLSSAPNKLLTDNADIYASLANERVLGGQGNDEITMGPAEAAFGEQGNDKIIGGSQAHFISGGLGNDEIEGGANFGFLFGDAGNDIVRGGADDDQVFGGIGNDILEGNDGLDNLCGGSGKDRMSGGASSDQFEFNAISDSRRGAARDVILDFTSDEFIDLSGIDARSGGADNAFRFIGKRPFHEKKGELHYFKQGNHLVVEGDVNGDGRADFQIQVHGVLSLTADNFTL